MNKITKALVGADDDFSHNTRDFRRCRCIVHIADVSALGSLYDIPLHSLKFIIGPNRHQPWLPIAVSNISATSPTGQLVTFPGL